MKLISFLKQIDQVFFTSFFRPDFLIEAQKIQRQGMNGLYAFMAILPVIFIILIVEFFVGHDLIILDFVPIILGLFSWGYLYYIAKKLHNFNIK